MQLLCYPRAQLSGVTATAVCERIGRKRAPSNICYIDGEISSRLVKPGCRLLKRSQRRGAQDRSLGFAQDGLKE